MYIIVTPEGYAPIAEQTVANPYLSELRTKKTVTYKINGKEESLTLIPFGNIALHLHNKQWITYKESNRTDLDWLYGEPDIGIHLKHPRTELPNIDTGLLDIESKINGFTPIRFYEYDGIYIQIASVNELGDLYDYDCYKINELGISFKKCKNCGRVFKKNTTGEYCDICKDGGIVSRVSQQNFKNNPSARLRRRILNRSIPGNRDHINDDYQDVLREYIDKKIALLSDTDEKMKFLETVDSFDRSYYKLCKKIARAKDNYNFSENPALKEFIDEWSGSWNDFIHGELDDFISAKTAALETSVRLARL